MRGRLCFGVRYGDSFASESEESFYALDVQPPFVVVEVVDALYGGNPLVFLFLGSIDVRDTHVTLRDNLFLDDGVEVVTFPLNRLYREEKYRQEGCENHSPQQVAADECPQPTYVVNYLMHPCPQAYALPHRQLVVIPNHLPRSFLSRSVCCSYAWTILSTSGWRTMSLLSK